MLIDDLLCAARRPDHAGILRRKIPAWSFIDRALVLQTGDVRDYVLSLERMDVSFERDLPNIAPLARTMWMEHHSPAGWTSGVLVHVDGDMADESSRQLVQDRGIAWPDRARWRYVCQGFRCSDGEVRAKVSPWVIQVWVSPDGDVIASQYDHVSADLLGRSPWESLDRAGINTFGLDVYIALTALCFSHCRGVTLTDCKQPRQLRRAAERAGRPPLVSYKTIDIKPVARILRDEGRVESQGIKRALHITRGHFAHYTEDAPLFGRYTGTFFRPMHVKGSLSRGVIVKDYRVRAQGDKMGPADVKP